jgi:hypothetical protein
MADLTDMGFYAVAVFSIVALVLIGIGIAVGLVACLAAAILLGVGVISSSFVVGLRAGRPSAGVRAFLLQCGILAGIPAGAVCAWLGHSFLVAYGEGLPILLYGALGGALAGIIVALSLDFVSRRLHTWASARVLASRAGTPQAIERGV